VKYPEDFINKVICGDSLELMRLIPDKSIDAVICDPPYGIDGGRGGQLRDYKKADYNCFDDTPEYIKTVCVPVINECLRIAKTVVLTPGSRCLTFYPPPDDMGCFYQPASSRMGRFGFQSCQPIFYYGYYKNRGKGGLPTGIILTEQSESNGHPCPKPIKAWTWLVERSTSTADIILDPFLGSGTTAVAAIRTGRQFIGFEIDPHYCEIAERRIRDEQSKIPIPFDEPAQPTQEELPL
jgi:DNA modification methylase